MSATLPHRFAPTPRQWEFRRKVLFEGKKRIVRVEHRRNGKDLDSFETMVEAAMMRRGTYVHALPELQHAKKIVWKGMDDAGIPFIERIPDHIIARNKLGGPAINENDLNVTLTSGSIVQLIGADKYDQNLVGTNVLWINFSEYPTSQRAKTAWDLVRPILRNNGGTAVFIFTPRGKNHGKDIWDVCQKRMREEGDASEWWGRALNIEDTAAERRAWGSQGPFNRDDVLREIEEGMDPFLAEQEYYCSFEGAMQGAIYGEFAERIKKAGQIKNVEYDPYLPVHTHCDIGFGSLFIILFVQETPDETRIIDCYAEQNKDLEHYANVLHSRGYRYGRHFAPWDAEHRGRGAGSRTAKGVMRSLGIHWDIVGKHDRFDGIQVTRRHFKRLFIDAEKCEQLIRAAQEYRWRWDSKLQEFSKEPVHDWASHWMDALRNWAMSGNIGKTGRLEDMEEMKVISSWDPYTGEPREGGNSWGDGSFG
ncbi:hypothetical protein CMI37_31405 [Candidatus Pacearchaeota archaeon]|nr:hypothetical protein [Candidatus Pacearchaeota archaeon]|tara:strand:+ start:1368 stop:2801 length:1434 start_codon:yes stop_codon:yes gene_type:complete